MFLTREWHWGLISKYCLGWRAFKFTVHLPVYNLTLFQKGAYFSGIRLFNHLPPRIKSLSDWIKLFKPALKRFLTHAHFIQLMSILNIVTIKNQRFLNNKQLYWIYNCIQHNYVVYLKCIWYKLLSSSKKNDYYIIFVMYDNELFCARYIYKYDNFYILMVIVTWYGSMECENK